MHHEEGATNCLVEANARLVSIPLACGETKAWYRPMPIVTVDRLASVRSVYDVSVRPTCHPPPVCFGAATEPPPTPRKCPAGAKFLCECVFCDSGLVLSVIELQQLRRTFPGESNGD